MLILFPQDMRNLLTIIQLRKSQGLEILRETSRFHLSLMKWIHKRPKLSPSHLSQCWRKFTISFVPSIQRLQGITLNLRIHNRLVGWKAIYVYQAVRCLKMNYPTLIFLELRPIQWHLLSWPRSNTSLPVSICCWTSLQYLESLTIESTPSLNFYITRKELKLGWFPLW